MKDQYESLRVALLKYYNSQCMTHAGYVISIFIGLMVVVSRFDVFIATETMFLFYVAISVLFISLSYAILGTIYWGCLSTWVLRVVPNPSKEEKNETPIFILHKATCDRVAKERPIIVAFKRQKKVKESLKRYAFRSHKKVG